MEQRIKDISSARLSSEEMAQQLQREIANLRAKITELENAKDNRPLVGQEAHERYTLERENNTTFATSSRKYP